MSGTQTQNQAYIDSMTAAAPDFMPPAGATTLGQDLLNVPFGEMVKSLGLAIAEAQLELDRTGVRIAHLMAGFQEVEDEDGKVTLKMDPALLVQLGHHGDGTPKTYNLLELGFTPTFYQFVDTIIEVKISISISQTDESSRKERQRQGTKGAFMRFFSNKPVSASSVDAKFSSKYQYSAEGSSLLRTKLVPLPPPAMLEERIREMMKEEAERRAPVPTTTSSTTSSTTPRP